MERCEGQVLELPLDRVDAEPVGQRGEDVERLARLLLLLVLGHRAERAHVVQAIGELDQDDPDVLGHRDHHLAVVLGLAVVAALEGDAGQLGHAVDQLAHLLAELLPHLVERSARVLDGVVQQRGAQGGRVHPHPRADLGHSDRVHDEVLAAGPALVGVARAREDERARDQVAIDRLGGLLGVLLHHREQVPEQYALVVGQAGLRTGGAARVVFVDPVVVEIATVAPGAGLRQLAPLGGGSRLAGRCIALGVALRHDVQFRASGRRPFSLYQLAICPEYGTVRPFAVNVACRNTSPGLGLLGGVRSTCPWSMETPGTSIGKNVPTSD